MKQFNKTSALRKIKFQKNKNTYIKRLSISLSCLILLFLVILFTFAKFDSSSDEYTMIDGKLDQYTSCSYNEGKTWTFSYTGNVQNFKVPCSGEYKIELWGAQGGNYNSSIVGALGGYTAGNIELQKDLPLYIYVGNKVDYSSSAVNSTVFNNGLSSSGGWNGGGSTDVRLVNGSWDYFGSIKSRIMVAGGGGIYSRDTGNAGPAGGLNGYNSTNSSGTKGGTQTSFGSSGYTPQSSFGIANGGCSGGNGYYPGAGATCAYGSGGGSSFISGYSGCNAISESSTINNIVHTNQPNHYSGLVFKNGVMIDGKGCNWSTGSATNCGANQIQPNGSKAVGHSGAGYARITLVSKKRLERKVNNKCIYNVGQEWLFNYTGNSQKFNVLCDGNYKIELWGAQGGSYEDDHTGELGGYVSGDINLKNGTSLYVYVGQGEEGLNLPSFNGTTSSSGSGSPGGGATDVRLVSGTWNNVNSLRSRIIVAGGGGSTQGGNWGGAAGGLTGYSSSRGGYTNTGGSQTAGGTYGPNSACGNGSFGVGSTCGATGGGGYYGGAGAAHAYGSGAGGSSYISGHTGCVAITSADNQNPKSGCTTGTTNNDCSKHYSGYVFTNTKMIDGAGYNWTNTKGSSVGQIQPNGTSATGHSGNGYARITLLSKE